MSEWKPGDVAMVECSDGEWRRAAYRRATVGNPEAWEFEDGARRRVNESRTRPLVVIDPEDREQVERLMKGLPVSWDLFQSDDPELGEETIAAGQHALRDFATPKREVHEHLPERANSDGTLKAHCGKVWTPGSPDVVSVGRCPECAAFTESGWTA